MALRLALAAATMVLAAAPAPAQQPAARAAAQAPEWNPQPSQGDLILPLPCGQGIVFRRIPVPVADGPLADRRVILGDEESDAAYAEFIREGYVAGPFGSGAEAHFWLGKYELTRGQAAALLDGCEAVEALPAPQRRLPRTGLSWLDANRVADAATRHLLGTARQSLPVQNGARAYVRLPTEAEWEYAARGASSVTDEEFRASLPPMDRPTTAFAQLRRTGQRAALAGVGMLRPDRLGLHDMLGNAEEVVADPFRLTRGGRVGGRVGGMVGRGGDANVAPDRIRTSMRIERPLYDADGAPAAFPFLGLRLALGLSAIVGNGSIAAIRRAWESEASPQDGAPAATDARQLLQQLERSAVAPGERRAVASIRGALEAERAGRVEANERAVRAAIGAGAYLIRNLRNEQRGVAANEQRVAQTVQLGARAGQAETDALPTYRQILQDYTEARNRTFAVISTLVLQQLDLPQSLLTEQLGVWRSENSQPGFELVRRFAGLFVAEVAAARPGRSINRTEALRRLLSNLNEPR